MPNDAGKFTISRVIRTEVFRASDGINSIRVVEVTQDEYDALAKVAELAKGIVASWSGSSWKHDDPTALHVRVSRDLWPTFAETVESL